MSLPYESATSGKRALDDIHNLLDKFGVERVGVMTDNSKGEILLQFTYHGRDVMLRASVAGYAAAWRREHPYTSRMRGSKADWEKKSVTIAGTAVYSILRDWVKGQMTAIETGLLSFEAAFLPHLLLPAGDTILERVEKVKMLPQPGD